MENRVSIAEHFKRLFDFSGREDRSSFWPYAAVAFAIVLVVSIAAFVPMMMQTVETAGNASDPRPSRIFSQSTLIVYLGISFGLASLLFAAAMVRRLRDGGFSPWWSLLPMPFIIYSTIQMPRLFSTFGDQTPERQALFFSVFISNMLYNVALIILIVLLALRSKPAG